MGVTGVGKTTFISHFAPDAVVGHGLQSCKAYPILAVISIVLVCLLRNAELILSRIGTSSVGIHEAMVGSQKIYLIDTPGFDDTSRSDVDVLREVADWLNSAYTANIQLAGIVYLHRIIDNRMSGSAVKNLRMFKQLCGNDALSSVVLATTMWGLITAENGLQRERELETKREFWAAMISKGSRVFRQDNGASSALAILEYIIAQRRRTHLRIQEEMADGVTLDETSAGQAVQAEMAAAKARYQAEMADIRREMAEALLARDIEAQREITAVRAELEAKISRDRADMEKLRVSIEQLHAQRMADAAREREQAHQRELALLSRPPTPPRRWPCIVM